MPSPLPPRPLRPIVQIGALCAIFSIFSTTAASAAEPAYYLPDSVAQKSAVFRSAAELSGPAFEARNKQLDKTGAGLRRLDLAVALLGDEASAELRAWTLDTRRQATGEGMRLQRHLDLLQDDYAQTFGAAVDRAAATVAKGRALKACEAPPRPIGMPGSGKPPCPGVDLSADLAAAIDNDPVLKAKITELNALPWPEVSSPSRSWPIIPLTGATGWINLGAAAEALIPERIKLRQAVLEQQLAPLEARIAAGDAAALAEAQKHRAAYDQALAGDGRALKAALKVSIEKTKGAPAVGICPSGPALGGCAGPDLTREVLGLLKDNKTWEKASSDLRGD
ncbi:MAG: hypothetical protein JNM72_03745 [Deltaproteobacteria bacterium]|nr:hypothetical protein [Deltaproteobacteria bacterium]